MDRSRSRDTHARRAEAERIRGTADTWPRPGRCCDCTQFALINRAGFCGVCVWLREIRRLARASCLSRLERQGLADALAGIEGLMRVIRSQRGDLEEAGD